MQCSFCAQRGVSRSAVPLSRVQLLPGLSPCTRASRIPQRQVHSAAFLDVHSAALLDPAQVAAPVIPDLADGLEAPVQILYLALLLAILGGAAFVVGRQLLVRREMDERAKVLGELVRTGEATSEDYFELGVILARKRLFTQAMKNYSKAVKLWDGEESELAQVHNAIGYCYLNMERLEDCAQEYRTATKLQPGYTLAWNNLGDVLERQGKWADALDAYEQVLQVQPDDATASQRASQLRLRVGRISKVM